MANEKNPYQISFTVGLNYITPAARQRVGISGNHNATALEFTVDDELRNAVENYVATSYVRYRFDVYNAASELFRTESQDVNESSHEDYVFPYALQERDTRYGGTVKVHLVLTVLDGEKVVKEVFCPPALLQFEGPTHGTSRYSYTELELKALKAADEAFNAVEKADLASDAALAVKQAYDNGELKGEKGDTGERGPQGEKGDAFVYSDFTAEQLEALRGPKGETGAQGPKGDKGDRGLQGIQGVTGPQGIQGIQGEKGDKGDAYVITEADKTEIANIVLANFTDVSEVGQ